MRKRLLLLLLCLLAFGLRVVRLNERPIWYDEALTLLYARLSFDEILYSIVTPVDGGAADVHPPLHAFLLRLWVLLAGDSVYAARYFSVLLGVISVAAVYALVRQQLGPRAARAGLAVAALAPFAVHYAQEIRMYALLGAMGLLATLALVYRRWWLYALFAALTVYSQLTGAFYLMALNLAFLARWLRARDRAGVRALLWANGGAVLFFSPWLLLVLPRQLSFVGGGFWIPRPGLDTLIRTLIALTANLPLPGWTFVPALALALAALVLLLYRAVAARRRPALWLLALALGPVLLNFAVSQWKPVYVERSFLPGALVYYGLLGWLLARGGLPRPIRDGLAAGLLLVAAVSLLYHYTYRAFPNSDFPALQRDLRARVGPGERIVHENKLSFLPAHYYDPGLPHTFLPDPPGGATDNFKRPTQEAMGTVSTPITATLPAPGVWFVTFERAIAEVRDAGFAETPHWQWYAERCRVAERYAVNDLNITHFEACTAGP